MIFPARLSLPKIVLLVLALCAALPLSAQDATALWLSMPPSHTPYLSAAQRHEMVEAYNIGVDPNVDNALYGTSHIDTLTADYARLSLSSARDLQLIVLPLADGDSIVAVIDAYHAPATQSSIAFYDRQWHALSSADRMPTIDASSLVAKPDTMSASTFATLTSWVEPTMFTMDYHAATHELTVALSVPFVACEEREALLSILSQLTLKWDGYSFSCVTKS